MRKVLVIAPLTALVLGGFASEVSGQTTATATATYEVAAINELSFTAPAKLVIASSADYAGVSQSATWDITTNSSDMEVVATVAGLATGLELSVVLAGAGTAGSGSGAELGSIAVQLVSGLSNVSVSGAAATYTLKADATAVATAATDATVTYTLQSGV